MKLKSSFGVIIVLYSSAADYAGEKRLLDDVIVVK